MLLHQDVRAGEPRLLRDGPRGAARSRRRRRRLRRRRRRAQRSPGGRARSRGPPSPTATRSTAAATSRPVLERATSCPPSRTPARSRPLDGFVLVLSPLGGAQRPLRRVARACSHGYDFDFCMQVRAAGRKIVTADFRVVHHHSLQLVEQPRRRGWRPHDAPVRREVERADVSDHDGDLLERRPPGGSRGRARPHRGGRREARRRRRAAPRPSAASPVTASTSWRHHRAAAPPERRAQGTPGAMIVVRLLDHRPRELRAGRRAGDPARRRAGFAR